MGAVGIVSGKTRRKPLLSPKWGSPRWRNGPSLQEAVLKVSDFVKSGPIPARAIQRALPVEKQGHFGRLSSCRGTGK